jgi:hypothetical protein
MNTQARCMKASCSSEAALPADPQAAELVQPGEGPLDDPAHPPGARAELGCAAGDDRLDAAGPQLAAVLVVVIAAVGDQAVGALAWPAGLAADRADTVDPRQQLGESFRLPPVSVAARGIPEGSTIR